MLSVVVAVAVVCGALALFGYRKQIYLPDLTRDPSAVTHTHFWVGALSFLGFALWGIGAGSSLAVGLALPRGDARRRTLLQVSAITAYLLIDDMLLLHEEVLPNLGVPEKLIYPAYVVVALAWFWVNRADIARTERILLGLSVLAFAASILLDQVTPDISDWTYVEDSLKFLGIALWATYLVHTSVTTARSRMRAIAV